MVFRKLAIAALVLAAACPAHAKGFLPVVTKTIAMKSATYDITVNYPQTGNKPIDADLAQWARTEAGNFARDAKSGHEDGEVAYALNWDFEVERNDAKAFAVLFSSEEDTGGAHPNHDFYAANYQVPDGWRVYLPELLDGRRALNKLSALVTADLIKNIATGDDAASDAGTIKSGTGADWSNFKDFILQPNEVAFYFPPYQVASYASGPQESHIPLSALTGLMRANARVPVPSFDCAKAATAVEKAICSDIPLARLDREVAAAYTLRMSATEGREKAELQNGQRTWMNGRAGKCAGKGDAALVACLAASYKARLAALSRY
jgi:uncharacterized protein YecT (DUF1311 family)